MLWYDYLQNYKMQTPQSSVGSFAGSCLLKVPAVSPPYYNSFEAQTIVDFLKGHFESVDEHFIASMNREFHFRFAEQYTDTNANELGEAELRTEVSENPGEWALKMIEEVKTFVMLTLKCLIHYYGGVVAKMMSEKPGEMYDLVLEIVFNQSLSNLLVKVFSQCASESEAKYQEKLQEYSHLKCKDLGIGKLFQLDLDKETLAYSKVIQRLKEIENSYSPLEKLKVIIASTRLICECVDDYWRDSEEDKSDELMIDADQILSIFLYIVFKARISNLKSHLRVIFEFGRRMVQHGAMGYYVTTLEACIEQVETMSPQLLEKIQNYYSN